MNNGFLGLNHNLKMISDF